ncbi:beta-ketoacyl-[acyl-carrier-protein] synthase family protein [Mucilaginibacter gotjawali]|uniref:3-oxoacyl-[acyl-carrier-protein] synthase 1 n=2 Tax=Mucilaginibacter gotjawali TaxID=1550579 RepID=A0A0X8X204_9SPHI|nr:beta-ketoacyl-[acyl-carrier-protein] synthase family protein [Mucilaginibacter gotjawali]MBB3054053.1 3-oxoacyl-(acyl-carrier-protein) synthase [Mucilaginibacter gotjawali]BAU54322.1 3-oxoacyl-[acyl-carrier-protein] synthase 2 [Mucilaginibacter gotjawali]
MTKRVVVTGLGVVSPNGIGVPSFLHAIKNGISGIKFMPRYEELNFSCRLAGMPDFEWVKLINYISEVTLHGLKGTNIAYGLAAALDAWADSGMDYETDEPRWETGCVFGNSIADTEAMKNVIIRVDNKEAKKLGSRVVEQAMNSGVTSYIAGRLGLGNKVITNSAACATGSQAILMGYEYIKHGYAKRMLTGSAEHVDTYVYGAFDSMRVLSWKFNDHPEQASRPMSSSAGGFVPGSGAGALVLEELDFALARNAKIYAEVLGGSSNSGGQRQGGTMTAANSTGVIRCIQQALASSRVDSQQIDLISGHLTATNADSKEIQNWSDALKRAGDDFPLINSLKSMIGHCLSAAGSIESVAAVLQIAHQFVHPNINLEDPNPEITNKIGIDCLPVDMIKKEINIVAKANFGFGDVNSCLIFSKYN